MTPWYGYMFYITVSFVGIRLSYVSSPLWCEPEQSAEQSIVRLFDMSWGPFDVSVI